MPIQEDFLPEEYLLKIEQNKRPIVGKDFTDLSEPELKQFISDAKTKYLYYAKDGVNVAYGKELDNKGGKFDIEMFACKKFAEFGHEVFLLPENYAKDSDGHIKVHGDTITDGRSLELKHTSSNLQGNYRKAKHQATDVFIHIQADVSKENALGQIRNAIRSIRQHNKSSLDFSGNVYMYFEQKNELALFEFDKKGSCRENNPRKK